MSSNNDGDLTDKKDISHVKEPDKDENKQTKKTEQQFQLSRSFAFPLSVDEV